MMTVPPSSVAIWMPATVMIGIAALGRTWRSSTVRRRSPLARATRTWSCVSTSSTAERVLRIRTAASGRLRLRAGRIIVFRFWIGSVRELDVADRRQPVQPDEKSRTSSVARKKFGTETPISVTDRRRRSRAPSCAGPRPASRRPTPGSSPKSAASSVSSIVTGSRSCSSSSTRPPGPDRVPEIALEDVPHPLDVLDRQRLVEPVRLAGSLATARA